MGCDPFIYDELVKIHEDLVKINKEQRIANRQATINNALQVLNIQSITRESILSADEIKQYYKVIIDELFVNTNSLDELMEE